MLPWADVRAREGAKIEAQLWRLAWLAALAVVIVNGVSYSAHYRVEQTGGAEVRIEAYEDAKRREARAEASLALLQKNALWEATAACSKKRSAKARDYCAQVAGAQAEIAAAAAIKSSGRPASADAGVETIAWITGVEARKVSRSIPLSWAAICDLLASLCLKSVLSAPKRRPGLELRAVPLEPQAAPQPLPAANPAKELADLRWQKERGQKKGKQKVKA